MGFEEKAHTADWALRVWADDLEGLFAEAARGMYALAGALPAPACPACTCGAGTPFVPRTPASRRCETAGGGQARVAPRPDPDGTGQAHRSCREHRRHAGARRQVAVRPGNEAEGQAEGPKVKRTFEAEATDAESLLVAFLSELVFAVEQEHLIFIEFHVQVEGIKLKVEMSGVPILSLTKAIKAVTYHNLQIQPTARGYEVEIVFDV
jgi:SHS2 domain-containing protein